MKTIWSGQLARSGRKPRPFEAELVESDGRVALIERQGLNTKEVSPHEIDGVSWMAALARIVTPAIRCVVVLSVFHLTRFAMADDVRKTRKVPCPAQCAADEESDQTQECIWHDKELYKQDGIGCRKYGPVCWCKPKRDKLPPVTTL